ncbi:TPA: hypothetical protein HIQ56_003643 [Escherichia coli]|nr:hypothetical protein [Escherichia coli]
MFAEEFPAPAGINHVECLNGFNRQGVPRASGDKPDDETPWCAAFVSSPRQRG